MAIDAIHGVVSDLQPTLFVHRNLLDTQKFDDYLRARQCSAYVPLALALRGGGDALTIDDSTAAAAEAALQARRYGHSVTLFVNGQNIEELLPYHFSMLNVVLDESTTRFVTINYRTFSLDSTAAKHGFRRAMKKELFSIHGERNKQAFVIEIGQALGVEAISVPPFLAPISKNQVLALLRAGVEIQNHGWTHARLGSLSNAEYVEDIRKGRQWLNETFGVDGNRYAVPNGEGVLPIDISVPCTAWFLLDSSIPAGVVRSGVINRRSLAH